MAVEISSERLPTDLEALRTEMDDLRLLRLAISVLSSHLNSDLASREFMTELNALLSRIEAKEREALQVMITVPLLNHTGMDVVEALRVLSESGLSVVLV
jgi:hypothetical protein